MTDDPNALNSGDRIWTRAEIESPCVKLCVIHPETRLCIGCARTMEEIGAWSRMTPAARTAIMTDLPKRPVSPGRRGGRTRTKP